MLHRVIIPLLSCAVVMFAAAAQAGTLNVRLIASDHSPPYQQFSNSFRKALAESNADIVISESGDISDPGFDLIITVGMKASESVFAGTETPVLAAMVPKLGYEDLLAQPGKQKPSRRISAIYLDQPWERQIDFIRAALPDRRRIGLLHSPGTRIDVERLGKDATRAGGALVAQPVHSAERLFSTLESILKDSDVLLAVPDGAIYSSSSIRNILLTSYRHGVPLVGLSQSYVNAGALCAIFSTPEQLAEQTSSAVILFARTGRLPDPQHPAAFTIGVNRQVARSLGIELPSPEAIRGQMDVARGEKP